MALPAISDSSAALIAKFEAQAELISAELAHELVTRLDKHLSKSCQKEILRLGVAPTKMESALNFFTQWDTENVSVRQVQEALSIGGDTLNPMSGMSQQSRNERIKNLFLQASAQVSAASVTKADVRSGAEVSPSTESPV